MEGPVIAVAVLVVSAIVLWSLFGRRSSKNRHTAHTTHKTHKTQDTSTSHQQKPTSVAEAPVNAKGVGNISISRRNVAKNYNDPTERNAALARYNTRRNKLIETLKTKGLSDAEITTKVRTAFRP
jgi:hypothetical protein